MKSAFLTVTDRSFFPGTLATVNSVLRFHPEADVLVVGHEGDPLSEAQILCLQSAPQVRWIPASELPQARYRLGAWEMKAFAAHSLCDAYDVLVGIDSDCLLCGPVGDEMEACLAHGGFAGGKDGDVMDYGADYANYGFPVPAQNRRYMSTSLYFCATTGRNREILRRWSECCQAAAFNGTGPWQGHGDQGILNAILYSVDESASVRLLPNELWSQHWMYWDMAINFRDGRFANVQAGGELQRSFHCGGAHKFWEQAHRDRILDGHPLQSYPYIWFLAQLFFGPCRRWDLDPCGYLAPESHHLIHDLTLFLGQVFQVAPDARRTWEELTDVMIERILGDGPRFLQLRGGGLSELIALIASQPSARRVLEIGSYEGGSLLALALRFANRDVDFYAVESFLGNLDGTMDGLPLPRRLSYWENLARFPSLRARLVPGDSHLVATHFDDRSLDIIFIDACHDAAAVLADIDAWRPKLAPDGILAGDDFSWPSVHEAVHEALGPDVESSASGCLWWCRPPASGEQGCLPGS